MFFIQLKPEINKINKYACELYGNTHAINGDVFIALKEKIEDIRQENDSYLDINKDLILKLKDLMVNSDFVREHVPFKFNPTTKKYENFYTLLNKCYLHFLNKKDIKLINFPLENIKSLNDITNTIVTSVSK